MKKIVLNSVDSTNDYIKDRIGGFRENVMVIAREQTAGRGQFDRVWYAETGKSLTVSFLLWNSRNEKRLRDDALRRIPYDVSKELNKKFDIDSEVVLPNDLYVGEKKLCGFLIETSYELKELQYAIVGIGLNVNNDKFPLELSGTAISIKKLVGKAVSIDDIIRLLEKCMERLYA